MSETSPQKRTTNRDSNHQITDSITLKAIERQEWPTIKQTKIGDKGFGIEAKTDIENGTIVCNYHGEILSFEEGHDRYLSNDSDTHVYMFKFEHWGQTYYIECHPVCFLKGDLIIILRKKRETHNQASRKRKTCSFV